MGVVRGLGIRLIGRGTCICMCVVVVVERMEGCCAAAHYMKK